MARVQVAGPHDGAGHVVAVVALAGAGGAHVHPALTVDVRADGPVVAVAHGHAAALVVAARAVVGGQGVGAVVGAAPEVLGGAGRGHGFHGAHPGQLGQAHDVSLGQHHVELVRKIILPRHLILGTRQRRYGLGGC